LPRQRMVASVLIATAQCWLMTVSRTTSAEPRPPAGPVSSTFAALSVRQFLFLWAGTAAGQTAFWVQVVAQGWLAYELTGSAAFLGLVSAAAALPGFLLMLPAGALADRWDRRAILLYTNAAMTAAAFALSLVVAASLVAPWHLVVLAAIIGCAQALNLPARQSLGPHLVGPRLVPNAVALFAVSFNGSRILGPAVAGALIPVVGLGGCFFLETAVMAVATGLTLPVRADGGGRNTSRRSGLQDIVDGLRFLARQPVLRGCTIVAALQNLFGMAYSQLMPIFAGDVLDVGAAGLGALLSAVGVGSIGGAFVSAALSTHPRKGMLMFVTGLVWSGTILAFAAARSIPVVMISLVVLGATAAITQIACQTILNLALPDQFRGRVMSVYMMTWSLPPLAALPLGWITDQVGAPLTVGATGVLLLAVTAIAAVALKGLWGFRDGDYERGIALAHS
jgi:MFS family permease